MVFSVMIVLLVGAGIVNGMYWDNMKSMYAMAPTTCFTDVPTYETFQWFGTFTDGGYWIFWWGWPDAGSCTESFFIM